MIIKLTSAMSLIADAVAVACKGSAGVQGNCSVGQRNERDNGVGENVAYPGIGRTAVVSAHVRRVGAVVAHDSRLQYG